MGTTGLVLSERYLEHDTGPHHPERPERLTAIHHALRDSGLLDQLELIAPQPIDPALIEPVHPQEYVARVRHACEKRAGIIDTPDCTICEATFEIALLAAGGVIQAVDAVMSGRIRNAFCAVRPPGHHAERRRAVGFCFFNNVAIAAEYLRRQHGLERLAIVDFDVHHGNGTQHHFDRDPTVFYASIHQDPHTLFPGTGFEWEQGLDAGVGTTLNVPMTPGSGDEEYHWAFEERILPALRGFRPNFLLLSAGFDAHRDDPLANIMLSTEAFGWMTAELRRVAEDCCQSRVVSVLEGGYDLAALAESVLTHIKALNAEP